jgi:competence protein ComEC
MGGAPRTKPIPVRELIAESPLVPVALSATVGLIVDRYLGLSIIAEGGALLALIVAGIASRRRQDWWLIVICGAIGSLAALYHHCWRNVYETDDISTFASAEAQLVHLRGVLTAEPTIFKHSPSDGLASFVRNDPTRTVLGAREILTEAGWSPITGYLRLTVDGPLEDLHVGDEVEVFGWLSLPHSAGNPGERDWPEYLRDQRILAEVHVRKTSETVTRLAEGWSGSLSGWLARLRGWGQRVCERELPANQAALASALLLGETAGMSTADWDKYIQSGVVHILAVSGIHLLILAGLLSLVIRVVNMPRRKAAIVIASVLVGYALLTGFRPPIQRATITAVVGCLAILIRRVPLPANSYALAWLLILALNPTEPFSMGCQLSFLYVAVMVWT